MYLNIMSVIHREMAFMSLTALLRLSAETALGRLGVIFSSVECINMLNTQKMS